MKVKNLLLASFASVALISCSQADSIKKGGSDTRDLKLELNIAKVGIVKNTADIASKTGDKSKVNKLKIYFTDTDGNILRAEEVSSDQIDQIVKSKPEENKGVIYKNLSQKIKKASVAINGNSELNVGGKVTESTALPSEIKDIQPTAGDKDKEGVLNAPLYGEAVLAQDPGKTNPETGNDLYIADITAKPVIARVQVYGKVALSKEIEYLHVTRIFLDNFKPKSDSKDTEWFTVAQKVDENGKTDLSTALEPYKFFDKGDDLQDKTKENGVYAYHIYPQTSNKTEKDIKKHCVNLIIEMKYKIKGVDGEKTEYGTLSFGKPDGKADDKGNQKLNKDFDGIEAAKIYNINLDKIDWTADGDYNPPADPNNPGANPKDDVFHPGSGGDTPNAKKIDVKVIVNIAEWTEEEIIPIG